MGLEWTKRFGEDAVMIMSRRRKKAAAIRVMRISRSRRKSVVLSFRGFEMKAEEVVSLVGVEARSYGDRGQLAKPRMMKPLLPLSCASFSIDFAPDWDLSEMLPALLKRLGGVDRLLQIRDQVKPKLVEIDFYIPAITSDYIQGGFIAEQDLASIVRLDATLGFSFF